MRSGFCAIVGRPNVGKSTLINGLIGEKVAITAPVPQTTRHAIRGILHEPGVQVVIVDTPGLHKPKTILGARLNEVARDALSGVDCVVWLVDGSVGIGKGDLFIASLLRESGLPVIACLNKVDAFARRRQLPALQRLAAMGEWDEVVPLSALGGEHVDLLRELIVARMPEGPALYGEEVVTDQTDDRRISEAIREKAIRLMREEVPHSIATVVEDVVAGDSEGVLVVSATIYVERDSQKGIVIGHGGEVLRAIGEQARPEIEELLGSRVYLDLRVKLMKEWQRDPRKLQRLGY